MKKFYIKINTEAEFYEAVKLLNENGYNWKVDAFYPKGCFDKYETFKAFRKDAIKVYSEHEFRAVSLDAADSNLTIIAVNKFLLDYLTPPCFKDLPNLTFPTQEMERAAKAMARLAFLMKIPEYNGSNQSEWMDWGFLDNGVSNLAVSCLFSHGSLGFFPAFCESFLTFKNREIAERFLKENRELIEEARPLL